MARLRQRRHNGVDSRVIAKRELDRVLIRLDDRMVDLEKPVRVRKKGTIAFEGKLARTIAVMAKTLSGRGDPKLVFAAEVEI